MRRSDTNTAERAEQVLRLLRQANSVSVDQISESLGVSVATARRDLNDLEARGLLRRTHGGAESLDALFYEPFRSDSTFQEQLERHSEEKRRIGMAAAELIDDGDTIVLTAGTTTTEVIRSIRHRRGITVVTNTVNIAMELSRAKELTVLVLGGFLRGDWFSLVGSPALQAMRQICPAKIFAGVNGIDAVQGLSCYNPDEAAINREMVEQSRRRIVVADHTKLGVVATHRFASIQAVHTIITDTGATDPAIRPFLDRGIEVQRV